MEQEPNNASVSEQFELVSTGSGENKDSAMPKHISIPHSKLLVVLSILAIALIGLSVWWSQRPPSPIDSSGNNVQDVYRKETVGKRTEFEDTKLPPTIPESLPRELQKEVLENYEFVDSNGQRQSVLEFTVPANSFDAMVLYSNFFIEQGWVFDPASVVNTDAHKIASARKDTAALQIVTKPAGEDKNISIVEISIMVYK